MELRILSWKCVKSAAVRWLGGAMVWALVLGCMTMGLSSAYGQSATGGIRGMVGDPTGAVIPGATVVVFTTAGKEAGKATSNSAGDYEIQGLPAGVYGITATAPGFAAEDIAHVVVTAGQIHEVNATLKIAVAQQEVQVHAESLQHISTSPENNANALVIKGNDLNALSDDPNELESELQALAGPSAGPNGGEIYIDGFTGGEMPPKSAIREIKVNNNPFSAEYDRLGYGRIEIFTKPGANKFNGEFMIAGQDSSFNSKNPLLGTNPEPPYYSYFMHGDVNGPLTKNSSYFASGFGRHGNDVSVLLATDPASLVVGADGQVTGTQLRGSFTSPSSFLAISPRVDVQLGKANTLTARWEYHRFSRTNSLGGAYSLPSQATSSTNTENTLQLSDSLVLSKTLVDAIRFQYRRVHNQGSAVSSLPSYSVQAALTGGGNPSQTSSDDENDFEIQNYFSGMVGAHSLNFGLRVRTYSDKNTTTSGSNGSYSFPSLNSFYGCYSAKYTANAAPSTCKPQQYTYTKVNNPVAQATVADGALFYQDDWTVSPKLTFSYGLRWETQTLISDKSDFAPRLSIAWALNGGGKKHKRASTVLRAGYGWFYDRFTVPNGFGASVPYVINTVHQNGKNLETYIESPTANGPNIPFYQYVTQPISSSSGSAGGFSAPTTYTIAPHMKAALDMEAAVGVDQQLMKNMTGNVTYVFSQGIHQFFTDNLSAAAVFPLADAMNHQYPSAPVAPPATNNLQYQSGGFYKESQVMVTLRAMYRDVNFSTSYTYSNAKGDTSGLGSVPSVSSYPGLDYGRTSFDVANRLMFFGNFTLPFQVSAAPMLVYNSGSPYNVTIGTDLTGNNQFNARPAYAPSADCAGENPNAPNRRYYSTKFGCLDTQPFGTNEKMIPYGIGTGPSNISVNMRLSKTIGIGPKVKGGSAAFGGGHWHGPGGLNGGGLSGNRGGGGPMGPRVARRYSLTLSAFGQNVLNHTNLSSPSGVLLSPTFGQSESLAGGFFGHSASGNRTINLMAMFNF